MNSAIFGPTGALLLLVATVEAAPKSSATGRAGAAPRFKSSVGQTELRAIDDQQQNQQVQALAKKGMQSFARGQFREAKSAFREALQQAPGNLPLMINLGLSHHRLQEFAEAEEILTKAVRTAPESGISWLILGITLYDQNKLDAALAALAQAVLYEPKDARAHHFLGVTIGRKGWYSGAEEEMRKALELEPNYVEAHFNLAVFYLQRNPPAVELARRHYQAALDLGAAPDAQVDKILQGAK